MLQYYKLIGRLPVACRDHLEWAEWMATRHQDRIVKQEDVGQLWVSTVFLGLDHSYLGGPPKLFETMIFDPDSKDKYQMLCTTWDEAEEMHADAVKVAQDRVRNAEDSVKQIGTISALPDNKEDT